ncbi:MAG: PAS domain S-box protein [Methylomonas sp.]|nr:PAS domain S-box protein [Methylomonas sp.]
MTDKQSLFSSSGDSSLQDADDTQTRLNAALSRLAALEDMERHYRATLEDLYLHQEELRTQNDELRHAQASLENARRRHQDLFDFSPVAQFLVSPNGMILKTNRVAGKLLGLGSNDLYNYHMPNLAVSSSDRVSMLNFFDEVGGNKMPPPITVDLFRRDGRSIQVQLHGSRSGAQQESSILLTAVDNHHLAELEQERLLRIEAERLCLALLKYANQRVFVTDASWRIVRSNSALCNMTRYQPEELLGQKLELFVFWNPSDAANWQALSALKALGSWNGETSIRDKYGAIHDVVLSVNAIRDDQGRIEAFLGAY